MGALSQGSAGGLPGMNLKAWALVRPDGTLVKALNVTSVTKGVTGAYTLNFTVAMGSTDYVVVTRQMGTTNGGQAAYAFNPQTRAVGSCLVKQTQGGNDVDVGGLFEVYE